MKAIIQLNEQHVQIGLWKISHLFFPCEKEKKHPRLIVCMGGKNYGYTGSLYKREVGKTHLLYLKDNLGPDGSNLWWLAYQGDFSVGESYAELIRRYAEEYNIDFKDICYVGNCVGGFGALYLSYMIGAGRVVAIAPYIAVGSVYKDLPFMERIMGTSEIDLDDYIFKHFNRHTEVKAHIFMANSDDMMMKSQMYRFIDIMITRKNLFVVKNLKINNAEKKQIHSAICYAVYSKEILKEFNESLERFYRK